MMRSVPMNRAQAHSEFVAAKAKDRWIRMKTRHAWRGAPPELSSV